MSKEKSVQQIAQAALDQSKAEGLSDGDQKWMAVGAVNRAARKAGVIGEELSPEMNAASQAVIKEVQKRGK